MTSKLENLFRKSEQLREPFHYSPLNVGEIRLLNLKSNKDSSTILSGELFTVGPLELDSGLNDSLPSYEALSYVRGIAPASCHIQINDCQFPIWPNLEAALRALAKQRTERLLWIDAICINQNDNAEKNRQVRMMRSIYNRAEGVLIWIDY